MALRTRNFVDALTYMTNGVHIPNEHTLLLACLYGAPLNIIRFILLQGGQKYINYEVQGFTPLTAVLHRVSTDGVLHCLRVIEILITFGSDVNFLGATSTLPLLTAAQNPIAFEYLLDNEADPYIFMEALKQSSITLSDIITRYWHIEVKEQARILSKFWEGFDAAVMGKSDDEFLDIGRKLSQDCSMILIEE